MAYASLDELKAYLPQLAGSTNHDATLQSILDRVSSLLDLELASAGVVFGTPAVGTRTIYGDGTSYLQPPVFVAGSVTGVTTLAGYAVPDYIEEDGYLIVVDEEGRKRTSLYPTPFYVHPDYGEYRWVKGMPYTVAATFGAGAMPAIVSTALTEACLELTVRTWRAKDAGFSDVIGVEGDGTVAIDRSYPLVVKKVLDLIKGVHAAPPSGIGVW